MLSHVAMGPASDHRALHPEILLVDDDEDIRETIADVLDREGYQTLVAANGKEALALLEKQHQPKLILLDMMMPVMDGLEFRRAQVARAEWADVPVVMLTASGAKAAEGLPTLTKPVTIEDLLQTVRSFVGRVP